MNKHIIAIPTNLVGIKMYLEMMIKDPYDADLWAPLMHEFDTMNVLLAVTYKLLYGSDVYGHRPVFHFRSLFQRNREDKHLFGKISERLTLTRISMDDNTVRRIAGSYVGDHDRTNTSRMMQEITQSLRQIIISIDKSVLPR